MLLPSRLYGKSGKPNRWAKCHPKLPERPVQLKRAGFIECLKGAPRGSSSGPGGMTYEHLKVLLDQEDALDYWNSPAAFKASLLLAGVPEAAAQSAALWWAMARARREGEDTLAAQQAVEAEKQEAKRGFNASRATLLLERQCNPNVLLEYFSPFWRGRAPFWVTF